MKTIVIQEYWDNGQLYRRYRETEDAKYHGLEELYHEDGTIWYKCYWNMDKEVKLENYHPSYIDIIDIRYYI